MIDQNQLLSQEAVNEEDSSHSGSFDGNSIPNGNGFTRIAIGALIGATLGGILAALANQDTTEQINQTLRGISKTAKTTAETLNNSVQRVGDAINTVAENVNDTTREVGDAVNSVTTNVGGTVKNTVTTVKGTADGVNETVKSAVNAVKESAKDIQSPSSQTVDVSSRETLYKLIAVDTEQVAK